MLYELLLSRNEGGYFPAADPAWRLKQLSGHSLAWRDARRP
jgi:hypothetical protein